MVDYDEIRRRDDDIRDRHMLEFYKVRAELDRDLKRKLKRLYIGAIVVFLLLCLFLYIMI